MLMKKDSEFNEVMDDQQHERVEQEWTLQNQLWELKETLILKDQELIELQRALKEN